MKLVEIKEVPSRHNNKVECYLTKFMQMNTPVVRVELAPAEYKSAYSAANSFSKAIKRLRAPVKSMVRNDQVFLVRTDM